MSKFLVLVVLIIATLFCASAQDVSTDLSSMASQFQSMINELKADASNTKDEIDIASLIQRLNNLQSSQAQTTNQNVSLTWYAGAKQNNQASPLRIVIVVSSFEGMYLNSGIGTFYASLSDFLISQGHTVTILYTGLSDPSSKNFKKWQVSYEKKGVRVMRLDPMNVHVTSQVFAKTSYQVYTYLKRHQQEFDLVHFPDWEGLGYYSCLAKHQGLAFSDKLFIVGLHGPSNWVKHANNQTSTQVDDLETDYLEKKSAELADFVWTPSTELVDWLISRNWVLPTSDRMFLMPFLPGKEVSQVNQKYESHNAIRFTELVFFGRLEQRKGLLLFADALDIIAGSNKPNLHSLKVTFLGRNTDVDHRLATEYLTVRSKRGEWPFKVNYITHKDRKGALEYMRETGKGRLALMPSLMDNAPYTVYECLYSQIPFLASNLPSTSALIHPEDRDRVLHEVTANALVQKIEEIVSLSQKDGSDWKPVRAVMTKEQVAQSWISFYNDMSMTLQLLSNGKQQSHDDVTPLVSVCITHFNRPQFLPMAIQSVKDQDYENVEVVLVDDGSTDNDALAYLSSLEEEFKERNWKIIYSENKYLGAARNIAVKHARGDYVIFLDDDNLLRKNAISTYVSVVKHTNADVATAAHDVFSGTGLPDETRENTNFVYRSIPLGASVSVGMFRNCFGDANFFVNRNYFISSQGFTEERDVGQEDYEYLARSVLSGVHLEALPEPLLYYRQHDKETQMMYSTDSLKNQMRSARAYAPLFEEKKEGEEGKNEYLKALASRRVKRDVIGLNEQCNATIIDVSIQQFTTLENVNLTFTVRSYTCPVQAVLVGPYICGNIIQLSNSSFVCTTVRIPLPGDYDIIVVFNDVTITTLFSVEVNNTNNPNITSAMISMSILVNETTFDPTEFTDFLAAAIGIAFDDVEIVSSVIAGSTTKRSITSLENLNLKILIIGNASISASDLATNLADLLSNNPGFLDSLGVQVLSVTVLASCDMFGCSCAGPFTGPDCDIEASCPNNCTGNGNCILGQYSVICDCNTGYTGSDCSLQGCADDCTGHGSCIQEIGSEPYCTCDSPWTGASCNESLGAGCLNSCSDAGVCTNGTCVCSSGRQGADCSSFEVVSSSGNKQTSDSDALTAVIVVVAVLAAVSLIAVIYIFYRRQRRNDDQ